MQRAGASQALGSAVQLTEQTRFWIIHIILLNQTQEHFSILTRGSNIRTDVLWHKRNNPVQVHINATLSLKLTTDYACKSPAGGAFAIYSDRGAHGGLKAMAANYVCMYLTADWTSYWYSSAYSCLSPGLWEIKTAAPAVNFPVDSVLILGTLLTPCSLSAPAATVPTLYCQRKIQQC